MQQGTFMNSLSCFINVLRTCETAKGIGSKEVIKKAILTLDEDGCALFKYALDAMIVFGTRVSESDLKSAQYSSVDSADLHIITNVLDKLISRELTGNSARNAIISMLGNFTESTAEYISRVINKDLQAGFSVETYNKVHPTKTIPVFAAMLANKCSTEEEFSEIKYPLFADVKYDGERNVSIVQGSSITHYSRSGKIAEHMNGLFDEELKQIHAYLGYDFVLDGERMAKNFIDTVNAKKSGKDGEESRKNMILRAFFIMPLTDWIAKKTNITMQESTEELNSLISNLNLTKIMLTDSTVVQNHTEMMKELHRVTTPGFQGMTKGQEGLILKNPDSVYEWDRSVNWCKVKKFFDADARIIGWEFGKNRNSKRMGSVHAAGSLEDGTYFECSVGSGWTDSQREEFAQNFEKFEGKTIVIKYQEVSKSKDKAHASLRFPTVDQEKLFRDDKVVLLRD